MTPNKFSGVPKEWLPWKESTEGFCDMIRPGMKEVLKEAEKEKDNIDELWVGSENTTVAREESVNLRRLLRHRTEGVPRKTIDAAEREHGQLGRQYA